MGKGKKKGPIKANKKPEKEQVIESAMTETETEGVTETGSVTPLMTVGGERVPVMVIYKGKKASQSMVQELLGGRGGGGGVRGRRGGGGGDASERSEKTTAEETTTTTTTTMVMAGKPSRASTYQTIGLAMCLTLMAIGLIIMFVGVGLYVSATKDQ